MGQRRQAAAAEPLRLHIGGRTRVPGWHVLDVLPGEHVDFVGTCTDLGQFGDHTVMEIYASHVLEHLSYQRELKRALDEFRRVLVPRGFIRLSVPDLTTLCELFVDPRMSSQDRFEIMRMMFGGQLDSADFHRAGLTEEFLTAYLQAAGFVEIRRVADLQGLDDYSRLLFKGRPVSVNMVAHTPPEQNA